MGIFLLILKYFLIFILAFFLMILFTPGYFSLNGIKKERYFFSFSMSWLWKIFSIVINKEENQKIDNSIIIFGLRVPITHFEKKKRSKAKDLEKQEKKEKDYTKYFSLFNQSFLEQSVILIRRSFKHILPIKYQCCLLYGFQDPADTGILTGFFAMVLPYIPDNDSVKIQPVFDKEIIQGKVIFKGRIILAVLIYYFLQFYFSRGVRQTIKKIRKK